MTKNINVEVKYKKLKPAVEEPTIIKRTEDGRLVKTVKVNRATGEVFEIPPFFKRTVAEDGEEVKAKDLKHFKLEEDMSEHPCRPFDRTEAITVIQEVPRASVNGNFLVESTYQLFYAMGKKPKKGEEAKMEFIVRSLYEEAERFLKDDLAGIALFSWGGFKQFYGILYPVAKDDQFIWVMNLAFPLPEYQYMMDIPRAKTPLPQPPTLQTLPPLEAILTV